MASSWGFLVVLMLLVLRAVGRAAGEAPASILLSLVLMLTMVLRPVGGAAGEPPAWILLPLVAVIELICLLRLRRTARASAVGRRGSTMLNKMLLAVTRGLVLLCRMVPQLFIRLVLLSMAPQAAHARVTVIRADQAEEETSKFEEGVKEASMVFTYIGLTYYLLPLFTDDWKKVFFDCFIPLSMWLDSAHCICVLILGLFFIKDIGERYAEILALFAGLMASFEAIHHYLELKLLELNQTPAHLQMTREIGKAHVTAIFLVYLVFPPLVVLQLDKKWYVLDHIDPDGAGSLTVSIILGVTACSCEINQILHAVVHRWLPGGNWDDDETAVRLVKIAAAGCILLSDGFDTYKKFKVQHYWKKNHCTRSSAIISAFSTGCAAILIVGRTIGPRRGANAFIFVVKCGKAIPRVAGEIITGVRYRVAEVLHGLQD